MSSGDFKDAILKDAAHRTAMERQATTPSFTALLESIVARRAEMTKAAEESKIDLVAEQGRLKPEEPYEIVKNLYYNLTESTKKSWREKTKNFESLVESAKNVANVVPNNMVESKNNIRDEALIGRSRMEKILRSYKYERTPAFENTIRAVKALAKEYINYASDLAYIETTRTDMTAQHATQVTALETNASYPGLATEARYVELKASLEAVAKLEQDIASQPFRVTHPLSFGPIHTALDTMTENSITLDPFYDLISNLCKIGEAVADAAIVERDMIQAIGSSGEGRIMKANKDLLRAVQSIEDALWSTAATKTEITDRLIEKQFEASGVRAASVKTAGNNQPDKTIENAYKLASDPKPTTSELDKGLLGSRPGFEGLR